MKGKGKERGRKDTDREIEKRGKVDGRDRREMRGEMGSFCGAKSRRKK